MSARALAKLGVETVLGAPALVRAGARRQRGRVLILAYHNIVPRGEPVAGDRSLHTDQAEFGRQLDELVRFVSVVPLRAVLDGTWDRDRPTAVITFDDAYTGALSAGVNELGARGLPATFFVVPAFVGGRTFWWDALARRDSGEVPDALRDRALDTWLGDDTIVRSEAAAAGHEIREDLPAHLGSADLATLRAAVRQGFDVGSHTWSHRNLAALDDAARHLELERARDWLNEHLPGTLPVLALPYGLGEAAAPVAARVGCRIVLRVTGGWADPAAAVTQVLPRWNVPRGLSLRGFRLRLAGYVS